MRRRSRSTLELQSWLQLLVFTHTWNILFLFDILCEYVLIGCLIESELRRGALSQLAIYIVICRCNVRVPLDSFQARTTAIGFRSWVV